SRDEHPERQRARFLARGLVAHELIAHLRSIPMDDAHAPSGKRQLDDRAEARARMPELIVDRGALAGRSEGIASERDDRRSLMLVADVDFSDDHRRARSPAATARP